VQHCAVSAASEDYRFERVSPEEVPGITLEISVLSPLERTTDASEVEVGRHGLYVVRGQRRGLLLPQVATDWGWDRETFLAQTCVKAGLDEDAWRDPATTIYLFQAQVFSE
jgi:AmmeMemoRadiSam system protein A